MMSIIILIDRNKINNMRILVIGGCRAQNEPGHGGLLTYETFILWLKFDSLSHLFPHGSKVYPGIALVCPGLQPPMILVQIRTAIPAAMDSSLQGTFP